MKLYRKTFCLITALFCTCTTSLFGSDNDIKPVTPNASSEARALLQFLYSISGKYTLTGQHNYPNIKDRNTLFAAKYIGKIPVVYSTDWGFAKDGDTDSHLARPDIVEMVKQQHRKGSIITICWHAVPPTTNEPVTFRQQPGSSPDSLVSVQGRLLDQQFKDILTPGTKIYKHWCAQVDTIAFYLKKLQDAHVPILWRPYHEMNGNYFWWGGRHGDLKTEALYRQIFDRFVNYHKLNNLIWVWSVDRPLSPDMKFSYYYPGNKYFDVLSLDVYNNDFNQSYYDSLVALSNGKPLALAEVGKPPMEEILKNQPRWTFYATWAGMVRNTSKKEYNSIINNPRMLNMEDTAYWKVIAPFRTACGLPLLPLKEINAGNSRVDFSGEWIFNEEKSKLDDWGVSFLPNKLKITQTENYIDIKKTFILEYADDTVAEEKLTFDGKEFKSEFMHYPRLMTAKWAEKSDTLYINSTSEVIGGGHTFNIKTNEIWTLQEQGNIIYIKIISNTPWRGERIINVIYDRL